MIASTKITAAPKPTAVATFLDTAKYEHMPKKTAKTMLSIKIDLKNNSMCSIIFFILVINLQLMLYFYSSVPK